MSSVSALSVCWDRRWGHDKLESIWRVSLSSILSSYSSQKISHLCGFDISSTFFLLLHVQQIIIHHLIPNPLPYHLNIILKTNTVVHIVHLVRCPITWLSSQLILTSNGTPNHNGVHPSRCWGYNQFFWATCSVQKWLTWIPKCGKAEQKSGINKKIHLNVLLWTRAIHHLQHLHGCYSISLARSWPTHSMGPSGRSGDFFGNFRSRLWHLQGLICPFWTTVLLFGNMLLGAKVLRLVTAKSVQRKTWCQA